MFREIRCGFGLAEEFLRPIIAQATTNGVRKQVVLRLTRYAAGAGANLTYLGLAVRLPAC